MAFDGRWWITYNGEIYNFRELRAGLEQRGERFASDCDTEVLLRLFVLDGPAMLERLNGIFAFAVWDDRDRSACSSRATGSASSRSTGHSATASSPSPRSCARCSR